MRRNWKRSLAATLILVFGVVLFTLAQTGYMRQGPLGPIVVGTNGAVCFESTYNNGSDSCLVRSAAGVLSVNNGTGSTANASLGVNTLTVGTGTSLARYARFAVTLSPAAVAANTCAAQSFTVTGVVSGDILIGANKPSTQAGLSVTPGIVSGANTATLNFCNNTAAAITPTASESYSFVVVQ